MTTKTFTSDCIFKVNDELTVVVDRGGELEIHGYILTFDASEKPCIIHLKDEELLDAAKHVKFIFKVVATIGSRLDGLPLIEIQDEDSKVIKIAENILKSHKDFSIEGLSEYQNGRFNGIIEGYKAAQSKYKFTEEDMKKAFKYFQYVPFPHNIGVQTFEEFIQSLQSPKLIQSIELEMEKECCRGEDIKDTCQYCSSTPTLRLKRIQSNEGGIIVPVNVKY